MNIEEVEILSRDGTLLRGHECHEPASHALVCFIHDWGMHDLQFQNAISTFFAQGFGVFSINLRGHGTSEGTRGFANDIDSLLDDIEELLMHARSEFNDLPIFLIGKGFGGLLVLNYLMSKNNSELFGAICSSPFRTNRSVRPKGFKLDYFLSKYLSYSTTKIFNHYPNETSISNEDTTLCHDRISYKIFAALSRSYDLLLQNYDRIKVPVLIYDNNFSESDFRDNLNNQGCLIEMIEVNNELLDDKVINAELLKDLNNLLVNHK